LRCLAAGYLLIFLPCAGSAHTARPQPAAWPHIPFVGSANTCTGPRPPHYYAQRLPARLAGCLSRCFAFSTYRPCGYTRYRTITAHGRPCRVSPMPRSLWWRPPHACCPRILPHPHATTPLPLAWDLTPAFTTHYRQAFLPIPPLYPYPYIAAHTQPPTPYLLPGTFLPMPCPNTPVPLYHHSNHFPATLPPFTTMVV